MTDATEQHDEWCAKNGCRCGKCPCGEFDDCHPMTDATELDEAMRARVSEYLATWEPYRGGQSLSTHGGKHLFLKDVRALLAALDEITRLRAALDEARAERDYHRARADVLLAKVGGGVALRGGRPGDYWAEWHRTHCAAAEGAAREHARAEAAESALAAVRALVGPANPRSATAGSPYSTGRWDAFAEVRAALDGETEDGVFGDPDIHARLTRAALATTTTPEETR